MERRSAIPKLVDSPHSSRNPSSDRDFENKAWTVEPAVHGNGALINALRAKSKAEDATEIIWVGSIGFPTDILSEHAKEAIRDKFLDEYQSVVVCCSDKDIDGHYAHYCKTILWPIFHYQVPDHPKSKAYADHSWKYYAHVNRAFADQVVATYKRGDTIWIHDYHLLLVPAMVREKLPDAKIGFFLHTAFPSSEVFRCLSTRTELLEGMLGADLIGFQTDEYTTHFLQTCSRLLTVEATAEGVQLRDRFVDVVSQPIGIDPEMFADARQDARVDTWVQKLLNQYRDKHIIVARDKLDNVHGVRQKLLAYELFLNTEPEWRDRVVLIQVATSATEQSELLAAVSDIVSRIESVHSSLGSQQPLTFLKQDIAFHQYLALLSAADVLMISALRDGMNLTAHEYVFCQDGKSTSTKRHGPLILSEFTGSAVVLDGGHLSINPWDYQGQARAIKTALEMSTEEKERRWSQLHEIVLRKTGGNWARRLSHKLDEVYAQHHQRACSAVPRLSMAQISTGYRDASSRFFVIDYEGTLAPHRTISGIPLGSPGRVLETLNDLLADPQNVVYVMSGRKPEELTSHFRTLPQVGLIAEDGCFIRQFGSSQSNSQGGWTHFIDEQEVATWKAEVRQILEYYRDRLEGSYIEERHGSLLLRYERADDQDGALRAAGECVDQICGSCKTRNIHAVPVDKAILVEQEHSSKATAAEHILRTLGVCPEFCMVVGDDRSDEVVYRWANDLQRQGVVKHVYTVTVGQRNTEARTSLTQGSTGLLSVLQKLAKISAAAGDATLPFSPC